MTPQNRLLTQIEQRRLWPAFHKDWLLAIRGLLRPQLPSEYAVFVESEVVLVASDAEGVQGAFSPDVGVAADVSRTSGRDAAPQGGTAAILDVEETVEVQTHYSLLLRRVPDQRLIAALELLSPSNKGVYGQLDRDKYLRKREIYLEAQVALLEIDALLEGERILPPQASSLSRYQRTAWGASQAGIRRRTRGWGWNDDDPLPEIVWSVEPGRAVTVDLGAALQDAATFNPWERLASQG